ncbi:BglG family transcription antiterminator [Pseudalkalibacillus hwajinpoensis]|uniref:BglG family transcription antiterminator n=1 Tax=Guptibacillus hwajinpoensis TaxID=208199 RepID=UPI00325ACCF2
MNDRQNELLRILLEHQDELLVVKDLADRLSCSDKTIRNDLDVIQPYIERETTGSLTRKPGQGILLEIAEYERGKLYQNLISTNDENVALSQSERILEITYELLMVKEPTTLQHLAMRHFINRSTLRKELERIGRWLEEMNLTLRSRQKVGLMIEGSEKSRRRALVNLGTLVQNDSLSSPFLKKQFTSYEIEIVEKELRNLQVQQSITYTDDSHTNLLYHTLFTIKRTKLRHPIQMTDEEEEQIKKYSEFNWSQALLKRLEIIFVVHFPMGEIAYLALHLIGAKRSYGGSDSLMLRQPEVERLGQELISRMTEMTSLSFDADDTLMEGLRVHLYAALNRIQYGLSVTNPMLQDIKRMYPYLFDLLIQIIEEQSRKHQLSIPEDEIAYLTLHFEAAVERLNSHRGKTKSAVIVCHLGVGMSQLLRTKLERKFASLTILDCIGRTSLNDFLNLQQVDLIISTLELDRQDVPHIVISPLLNTEEESKLESFILKMDESIRAERRNDVFSNYLQSDLVFMKDNGGHRFKVIEELSNALYHAGFVEKEYAHNAIIRERASSTAIGSGMAIPHGNPNLIRKSAIAIAVLKKPIEWGEDQVNLVFLLAIGNQEKGSTCDLFREISTISEQPLLIKNLIQQTSAQSFIRLLDTNSTVE